MIFSQANDAALSIARVRLGRLYVLVSDLDRRACRQGETAIVHDIARTVIAAR